jgi:uncharacterized cupredoxin-like copper-binding protein
MTPARTIAVLAGATALLAAACGGDDGDDADLSSETENDTEMDAGDTERTVEIDMVDIAYEPDELEVTQGETVSFTFTNTGALRHDAFIGDAAAQEEHEREMREAEEMDDDDMDDMGEHAEDGITVEPGETGEMTHTFDQAGTLEIGCHEPDHYAAGMIIEVTVT